MKCALQTNLPERSSVNFNANLLREQMADNWINTLIFGYGYYLLSIDEWR